MAEERKTSLNKTGCQPCNRQMVYYNGNVTEL